MLDFGAFWIQELRMLNLYKAFLKICIFHRVFLDFVLKNNNLKFNALCLDFASRLIFVFSSPFFSFYSFKKCILGQATNVSLSFLTL